MIIKSTPSYIRLEVDGKQITIDGEAGGLAAGMKPYFAVFANSIKNWDPPFAQEKLDAIAVQRVLEVLQEDCRARNFPIVIE